MENADESVEEGKVRTTEESVQNDSNYENGT